MQLLVHELGGDVEQVRAYNQHGSRDESVVEIACVEANLNTLM